MVIFAMVYGVFAGGYSALWAGMMKEVQKVKGCEGLGMGVLMGVFAAGRGIGAVTSGPVSEVLLGWKLGDNAGFGGEYGAVIVFTGISALAGGVGWCVHRSMRGQVEDPRDESLEGSVAGSSLKKRDEAIAEPDQKHQDQAGLANAEADAEVDAEAATSLHHDHVEAEAHSNSHSKAANDPDASSQRAKVGGFQASSPVT